MRAGAGVDLRGRASLPMRLRSASSLVRASGVTLAGVALVRKYSELFSFPTPQIGSGPSRSWHSPKCEQRELAPATT
jgi:hypothetical protein